MLTLKQAASYLQTACGHTIKPAGLAQAIRRGKLKAVWNEKYRVWETTAEALDEWRTAPSAMIGNQNAKGNKGRWGRG